MNTLRMVPWFFRELGPFAWLIVALFGLLCGSFAFDSHAMATCLDRGYPAYHTTLTLARYCSRRINNNDEVIKLP